MVLYGPEGIGKSTFAAKFPSPVFIDTEGGTKKLNVNRLPQPTSWAMLMDEANEVRLGHIPCGTLVIDTADWAERLCIRAVCDRANVKGIEDFGYGKGYTYLKEEFGKLLDLLEDVLHAGHNVVMTAHAQLSKFEQPDEMGQYDRWTMKTSKQVAPLIREWCDMLLFANYKTIVVKDGDGKNAKNKAQGGRRVMYTTHHPCWDAKNRDGLTIQIDGGEKGHSVVTHRLYLHTRTEGLLCAFFESIGQRKHGEALRPRWNEVNGSRGRCRVGIHEYTNKYGDKRQSNEITRFLPPEEPKAAQGQSWTQGSF